MKRTLLAVVVGGVIGSTIVFNANHIAPSEHAKTPAPIVLHEETVIKELTKSAQLVTLTGKAEKTEPYFNDKWYGIQSALVNVRGQFLLGINTEDIEVTTAGNVVKVRLPQPKLISLDLPYDRVTIHQSNGLLRKDVDETKLKALYRDAKSEIKADIANDKRAQDKAEASAEKTVRGMVLKISGVEAVVFD
jgi:Protein of unknown function (DUF4230)